MKPFKSIWPILIGACLCSSATTHAQQDVTNQITLSARFGFNISARFKGLTTLPPPSSTRKTPHGDAYNYDDGYVLSDSSGNFGGQTWYWGYDDSSKQISGNNILMSRSSLAGGTPSVTLEDEPSYGAELVYSRLLGTKGRLRYGFELAANYLNLSLNDSSTLRANALRTSYPYPFTSGTTPPSATPATSTSAAMPYQGSYEGPGFVLGDTPGDPITTTIVGGASIQGHRQFDADLWGFRLGPYLELPVGNRLKLSLSGGLAAALLDGNGSWSESVSIGGVSGASVSGNGHAAEMLWGFYVGANASWQFSQRWSAVAGVQYQDLGDYSHAFGGRQVDVNMSQSIFATVGLSFNF